MPRPYEALAMHPGAPPSALAGPPAPAAVIPPHGPHGTATAPTPMPPSPFSLTAAKDDTALYQDARAGFSHLLPGRPVLGLSGRPGDPPADAVVHLQDAPLTLRYALAPPAFAAPNAAEVARLTAESYSGWRAQSAVRVDFANPSWLAAWGVEAAAVAAYDVSGGSHREDLFVLVRQGLVLTSTWTYPCGFVDDPAYATFASIAEGTMIWDPARWQQRGRVWPESVFWGAGLFGRPRPKHNERARQIATAVIPADERGHLLAILTSVVSGAGAPWVPLAAEIIEGNRRAILGATRSSAVRAFVEEAFPDVTTAHDLRGLAVLLGRALDGQIAGTTSSAPPPPPLPAVRVPRA